MFGLFKKESEEDRKERETQRALTDERTRQDALDQLRKLRSGLVLAVDTPTRFEAAIIKDANDYLDGVKADIVSGDYHCVWNLCHSIENDVAKNISGMFPYRVWMWGFPVESARNWAFKQDLGKALEGKASFTRDDKFYGTQVCFISEDDLYKFKDTMSVYRMVDDDFAVNGKHGW